MKLVDLDPRFYSTGGAGITNSLTGEPVPERTGMGLIFDCPCGCTELIAIPFHNPISGGPPAVREGQAGWHRTGETFETLTLTPSILRVGGCQWHGFVTDGEIRTC